MSIKRFTIILLLSLLYSLVLAITPIPEDITIGAMGYARPKSFREALVLKTQLQPERWKVILSPLVQILQKCD
jgi:hypothetical protein